MVELKVDLKNQAALDSECFVAVRVGETQKLSRLAATRSYKFPQAGERRYGKIEIYRRIGSCGVDLDPKNTGARNVNIGCEGLGPMQFSVEVGAAGGAGAPAPEAEPKEEKGKGAKGAAAKEYLRMHSVELQLTEAMQALLRAKPDNPVKFLAERLLSNLEGGGVGLASPAGKAPPAAAPPAAAPAAAPAPAPQAKPPVEPRAAPMQPFGAYFDEHFKTAPAPVFASLFSKFPAARRVEQGAPAAAASAGRGRAFAQLPSVGTWCAPRFKKASPSPAPASAPTAPSSQPTPQAAPAKTPFRLKPSVGTWVGRVQKPFVAAAAAASAAKAPPPYPLPQKKRRAFGVSSGAFGPHFGKLGLAPRMLFI